MLLVMLLWLVFQELLSLLLCLVLLQKRLSLTASLIGSQWK